MGLFSTLAGASKPLSSTTLADECGAELSLVERLLRALVGLGAAKESDSEHGPVFSSTPISISFADTRGAAAIRSCSGFMMPGWIRLPEELKARGYRTLQSGHDTVFNKAYGAPGKTIWEILSSTPFVDDWAMFMASFAIGHQDWLDFYPVEERLIEGSLDSKEAFFMIDVVGSHGSQSVALRDRYPHAPGRFIVQDLVDILPE